MLQVEQVVEFMCEVEDGWWKGRAGGRVGVFPSNFVEMCPEEGEVGAILVPSIPDLHRP